MGTGAFKRRCFADPFSCIKGYFHDQISGERIDTPHACRCPNKQGTKLEPNCHTCEFHAGGHGECTICKNKKFLHGTACVDTCQGTGLAPYNPAGPNGWTCREAFTCMDGIDQTDGETECRCPKKLEYCDSCAFSEGSGASCIRCTNGSKRPYLHAGVCVKQCPATNPAKEDDGGNELMECS